MGNKRKVKISFIYKVWLVMAFIFLKVIKPLWREREWIEVIKGIFKVVVSPIGVIPIDENRYITRSNGWEQLNKFLKAKGYETHILFRNCEFWKNDEEKKKLYGRNIGEYFILWEGDEI